MTTDKANKQYRILDIDPWITPFEKDISLRMQQYEHTKDALLKGIGTFKAFANGHLYYGFHQTDTGWYYREWAPGADELFLIGEFNNWNPTSHPLSRVQDHMEDSNIDKTQTGVWQIFIPGRDSLKHLSLVKVRVVLGATSKDRIPLYIHRTVQNLDTHDFCGQIWNPNEPFSWSDNGFLFLNNAPPLIYEAHVGMAQEKEAIGSYREFADHILPRIHKAGYNTIQLMAIMSHPYYASFGYHVSNFFAASDWFGTPDDLKYLIDKAHSMEIGVLMDIVHSHAVKNTSEGINEFDGTREQFFHKGQRGLHPAWDSMVFDYSKHEVIHFLLSNIKYWMEEYHLDGFRFDGITSMLYLNHGLGVNFDNYKKYFDLNTDLDALNYLQFANELIREINPLAITIAEDMSGMPGMCLPIQAGGIGFDYRLNMGIPDYWIKLLKTIPDEFWNMGSLWYELTSKRPMEKTIGYCESHDQALVGDKTIFFRLADKEIYDHMSRFTENLTIERAIALHKLIRFMTLTLSGDGYLNFMGNEFGHPEWIDFPREGNNWSFKHCRRQWNLVDSENLRFAYLNNFDRQMLSLTLAEGILTGTAQNLWIDEENKLIAFEKNGLVFLFNFNPIKSFPAYELPVLAQGSYKVVFSSDDHEFGGHARISKDVIYDSCSLKEKHGKYGVIIYSPNRTVLVLKKS